LAGYVRQSSGEFVTDETIEASDSENEFVALAATFDATTGHEHDGTTGDGPKLALTNMTGTLPVANGGTGATTLTDGGVLLGAGTGAITALAALADGSIVVGDGATAPVALAAFTSSTGTLKHESGGIEADISAITTNDFLVGTGAGTIGIENAATALVSMGAAASGANSDITSLTGLTTDLTVAQGGTGAGTFTDGGLLLGRGTAAISTTGVLAKGVILVGDATTDPTQLTVGANTEILIADSAETSGVKWGAASAASTWTLISSQTASASASIDFTSGITSTYATYALIVESFIPATDGDTLILRTDSNAGASFDAGASDYSWAIKSISHAASPATTNLGDNADTRIKIIDNVGLLAGEFASATLFIRNPSDTGVDTSVDWRNVSTDENALSIVAMGSGIRLSTTAVDAIQVKFESGNITSGRVTLWGIAHV